MARNLIRFVALAALALCATVTGSVYCNLQGYTGS